MRSIRVAIGPWPALGHDARMKRPRALPLAVTLLLAVLPAPAHADDPPLLPRATAVALAAELSGDAAKRSVETLARQHRMRGSRGFHAAAEYVAGQLRAAGLEDVRIEAFPADGHTYYGTQKSRRPWD